MNSFVTGFGASMNRFYENMSETEQDQLLSDILTYANENRNSFRRDLIEVRFDAEVKPLPVVLMALAKDPDNWGDFFVETLEVIFSEAKRHRKPDRFLNHLMEYAYVEKVERPFVKKLVDILQTEANSDHVESRLAAISLLVPFLKNRS